MKTNLKEELPFCECGCGKRVSKSGNRFIKGHNSKEKNHPSFGKQRSEEAKEKQSKAMTGKYCGKNNPMYGKRGKACYLYGTHRSKEVIGKISKSLLGKNNPMYGKRGKNCHNFGNKASEETRKKMSLAQSGENHSQWKGGISFEPYCQIWTDKEYKRAIREDRDNNVAWDIGYWYKGGLCINHINFDKKDCRPKNLITVSIGMNSAINNHREFYTEWFQIAMNHRLGYEYGT